MRSCKNSWSGKFPCVTIDIKSGYDNWFQRLHKSARQNIRTAYNRLRKEGKSYDFQASSIHTDCLGRKKARLLLYSKRIIEKNDFQFNPNSRVHIYLNALNRFLDPMTAALNKMKDSIHMDLIIDGELAAFLSGFITESKTVIVPRLAIDTKFRAYSPGIVLIAETIRYLTQQYPQIEFLDLSRGDESYKIACGGQIYYNFQYEL